MRLRTLILPLLLLASLDGAAQEIVRLNIPTDLCVGADTTASLNVSFGINDTHSVVLQSRETSLGHSERIFLPDGVPCNGRCTYRSPVTFNSFSPGATVTSVNDIKYVRLNMEHSYIGDLYIGIRCPNGTRATLMRFDGSSSPCRDTIPYNARNWLSGNNVSGASNFGIPYSYTDSDHKCDSTRPSNAPGIGWNYCWSNNTNSGYTYASVDGIIYRNRGGGYYGFSGSIDSSNVNAGTRFYHPDQNFSALIGCPLNGTWAIEVIDGYSGDNGYIFEWELALAENLLPPDECTPVGYIVDGPGTSPAGDSLFHLQVPGSATHDTSVTYTFRVISSCGDTIDTTANITVHPSPIVNQTDTACGSYTYKRITYTADTVVVTATATSAGCDSLHALRITIHPTYDTTLRDTIVENQLPYTFRHHTFTQGVTDTLFADTTIHLCDSTTHYSLHVYPNRQTLLDTTLCDNQLPLLWSGRTYNTDIHDTLRLTDQHGADSLSILHLTVHPTFDTTITDTVVENDLPYHFCGTSFTASADTAFTLTTQNGCDSTVHLHLTVHPNHSHLHTDTICDNQLPYTLAGHTFGRTTDTTFTLTDQHGADSTVSIRLTVHPTYHTLLYDTLCDNQLPYLLAGQPVDTAGTTTLHLATTQQCDSTLELHLTIHPTHTTVIYDTLVENNLPYHFNGQNLTTSSTTTVTLANLHGCDSTVTLHLTVHPNHSHLHTDTICDNQLPYTLAGHTFGRTTDTTFTLTDQHGADSTVSIRLTVHPTYHTLLYDTLCDNQLPYLLAGQPVDTAGTTTLHLATTQQCDSTLELHLTIHPTHTTTLQEEIVENDLPYTLAGHSFEHSIDTALLFANRFGCDSTVNLQLTVHLNHSYTYSQTICDDQLPYTLAGHKLSGATDTTLHLLDRHGADSTVSIRLTVHPTFEITLIDTTCDNVPYTVGGHLIDSSGYHLIPLETIHLCDSIVHLQLTIHPTHQVDFYDTICINTSYTFGDDTYDQSGDYPYPSVNQYGCDSLTTLHLGILAGSLKAKIHTIPKIATIDNPHIDLYDQSTYCHRRLWTIDGNDRTDQHITYTFPHNVDSTDVRLIAYSIEGCSDTTYTTLLIDYSAIYIPNAFTPTESTNNRWYPVHNQLAELEIWIYDRNGLLVRHLEGTDAQWDGTSESGAEAPQGGYVYNLTYRTIFAPNRLQRRTGTITLIR